MQINILFSIQVRVSAIFSFVSFMMLLSVSGLPAHICELKVAFLLYFISLIKTKKVRELLEVYSRIHNCTLLEFDK